MNKKKFLTELEKRLVVIDKNERDEILIEYSQNIDDKVANGMDEEAAVEGFGDVKEFSKELLTAYKSEKGYFIKSINNRCEYILDKIRKRYNTIIEKQKANRELKLDNRDKTTEVMPAKKKSVCSTIWNGIKNIFRTIEALCVITLAFVLKKIWMLIKISVYIMFLLPMIIFAGFTGMLFVLSIIKYPTVGLCVLCFSILVALFLILVKVFYKIQKYQYLFLPIFISSVIIGGIGLGITICEITELKYDQFKYDGKIVNDDKIDFEIPLDEHKSLDIIDRQRYNIEIIEDENVEKGILIGKIEFDGNLYNPDYYCNYYDNGIELFLISGINDDIFWGDYIPNMTENLKNGKLLSIDDKSVLPKLTVEIRVNPEDKKLIR